MTATLVTPRAARLRCEQETQVAAAAREVGESGVAVLGSRPLWDLVTSFMTGYPIAVCTFYQASDAYRVLNRLHQRLGYHGQEGVLLHLAIAANNPEMLKLVYKLAMHPQYKGDPKLRLSRVMRCAVLYNRVDMLECLKELRSASTGAICNWEPNLMRIAVHRADPDIQVLDWLYAHLPRKDYPIGGNDLRFHVERGDLRVVKWLYERRCSKITQRLVNAAAICGHAHILEYLYQRSGKRCNYKAVLHAAKCCFLDVLKLIFAMQRDESRGYALCSAAEHGHIEVVKMIVESDPEFVARSSAINYAAWHGHLEIVKYLHSVGSERCSAWAMSAAAARGHLDVVKYLCETGSEGCEPNMLEDAVKNGHLEVVKFLLEKYDLECSQAAIDRAVICCHIGVVEFLQRNRKGS